VSEKKHKFHSLLKRSSIYLKGLMPVIAIIFGSFFWLGGFEIFFKDTLTEIFFFELSYFGFWFITLCFIFKKFFSIELQSKLLVLSVAIAISIEFWVLLYYNNFSDVCLLFIHQYTPFDVFIITLAIFLPSIEALIIGVSLCNSNFQFKLNHLTNITRIKNLNKAKIHKLFEIWTSFPIFIGIYHICILLHELLIQKWCYHLSSSIMVLIAVPWIILMLFYIIYSVVIILKKRPI